MIEKIKEIIKQSLNKLNIECSEIIVEVPNDNSNGDYASNIALKISKQVNKNPRELASEIISNINESFINKIEIAGPGFINFYVKKDYLYENINTILKEKENYGKGLNKNIKINLEYVSANPTGTLHVGHGRGAAYGSSLANVLSFAGYEVTREYYINDGGNQINNLNRSIKIRYRNLCGYDDELDKSCYHGKEIITVAKAIYDKYGDGATDEKINEYGINYLLEEIRKDLTKFKVNFDVWSSERVIYQNKEVDNTLKYLIDNGYTYEQDGALFLKTTLYGDDKDRVLVKQDKDNTYLLPDIAYHINKYNRGFDYLIDVLGADHHGYINRLKASIKMMGKDETKLTVKILQMVRLLKDGEEIKLSKRTGKTITLSDLIEEVGVDATRYFFVSKSLDTQLDFDLGLAVKKSNENPIYYIEYAHARICSILKNYNKEINSNMIYKTLSENNSYNLLVKLYEFPEIVKAAANKYAPHMITNYVYELASLFHTFYNLEHILTEDELKTSERINLIKAVSIVIENALNLISIDALEEM